MDVQMPIMDGYRATHVIRHHMPYKAQSQDIAIVGLTASAIHGDREKCMKAGMDDYLAKPVRGKILEKMLVKWIVKKRKPGGHARSQSAQMADDSSDEGHGSECPEPWAHESVQKQLAKQTARSTPSRPSLNRQHSRKMIEMVEKKTIATLGTESEGDRVEERLEAEDTATRLRDNKLIQLAESEKHGEKLPPRPLAVPDQGQGHALTEENVEKLEREGKGIALDPFKRKGALGAVGHGDGTGEDTDNDSMRLNRGSVRARGGGESTDVTDGEEEGQGRQRDGRPRMERRWMDSDATIINVRKELDDSNTS